MFMRELCGINTKTMNTAITGAMAFLSLVVFVFLLAFADILLKRVRRRSKRLRAQLRRRLFPRGGLSGGSAASQRPAFGR